MHLPTNYVNPCKVSREFPESESPETCTPEASMEDIGFRGLWVFEFRYRVQSVRYLLALVCMHVQGEVPAVQVMVGKCRQVSERN